MKPELRSTRALWALRRSANRAPEAPRVHWGSEHNCQAYALGSHGSELESAAEHRPTWLQPGQGSIIRNGDSIIAHLIEQLAQCTPEGADLLWQADGLVPHTPGDRPRSSTGWEVLGFVAPGEDFHLVRKDANGRISHKSGTRPASRTWWGVPLWLPLWTWRGVGRARYRYVGSYWCEPSSYGAAPQPALVEKVAQFAETL